MKSLIVNVSETGEIKIDLLGFKGKACEQSEAAKAIQKALGTVKSDCKKPEYYQQNQRQAKVGQ